MKKQPATVSPLDEDQLEQVAELCERFRVEKLYLFGSAVTEDFRPDSDIDLLVTFETMNLLEYADNYFELVEELERALERKIDLVIEKDLSNPVLIDSIVRNRKLIYEKKEDRKVVA